MPLSLKTMLKKFVHKGQITTEEYDALIKKLEGHDKEIRNKVIDEFAEKLNAKIEEVYSAPERESEYNHAWKTVCRIIQGNMEVIAEQLKEE